MNKERMNTRRIRLLIGYDGYDFCGWQIQPNVRTVQYELESVLKGVHGHPLRVYGSGRTDAGVHATGQVAHFDSDIASIPAERYELILNSNLPKDVRVYRSEEVPGDFHARFGARKRSYRYVVKQFEDMTPMDQRYCFGVPKLPSLVLLNAYARYIVGIHDFTTFSAAKDTNEIKVREIFQAVWTQNGTSLEFTISGNAFLWKMVRSLVGTMIDLAIEKKEPEVMRAILNSLDRTQVGNTAPPHGLRLERIDYE